MEKKQKKIEVIKITKEGGDVILFEVKENSIKISDRCKISGIQNIVKNNPKHPNSEIYKAVLNSLGGSSKNEAKINKQQREI